LQNELDSNWLILRRDFFTWQDKDAQKYYEKGIYKLELKPEMDLISLSHCLV
jgi:hypothetical protein